MEVEGVRIGVRCSSATTLAALREALAVHLVDGVAARANYSVREAEAPGEFHLLYRGGVVVVRTLNRARLLTGVLGHLFGHGSPPPGMLRVDALALVRDGSAVLAPARLRRDLARIERRLAQKDFAVLDAPFADVDPEQAELVVPSLPGSLDPSPLDALAADGGDRRRDARVEPGRYPLVAWAFPASDEAGPLTRAAAAQLALRSTVIPSPSAAPALLQGLGRLLAKVTVGADATGPPLEVAATLDALAGRR